MSDLVAALHAELAAIHGIKPGHSLTGDYAALKPDAERLARVRDEHVRALEEALAHATEFKYHTPKGDIIVDQGPNGWEVDPTWAVFRNVETHPDRDTALARARELAQEST